ncbi:sensor histidine kinase [Halalkalibacter okhensis]|uniref:histidine kinase n=1 Tax=Halalkalibacter okhensis TaxID=333138 RepID=A0A0B0I9C6_9BACI|nr:sensor histidine kinase [Halalkalibacter okhensis]KHF39133.1 histidine kinase [Halalkalibacter okhensis]
MKRIYIKERRSWIVLFLCLQILLLFIAYVDPAMSVQSMLYGNLLSVLIFIVFLLARYQKETLFFKSLDERDTELDVSSVASPNSPFEEIVEHHMTRQIEQLKLELTQNQQQVAEEKDELLAWIHEVKTPLTAMKLMIDRVQDEELKGRLTYEWLRIHLLLDQQLHQKRLPVMENDLYIEKTSLEQILFEEIKTLQSWCIQKGIGFDVELEVDEVLSDAKWLAFLIRQLLSNAVKYSEASDIVITSTKRENQTLVTIEDSGCGIDPKDLPRIFEKGFTSTLKHRDHAATGMGLYLVKKIAKQLLIKIDVHSTVGKGTTVTLLFPKSNAFIDLSNM